MREKGRLFALFPPPTGPEKIAHWAASLLSQRFFSGASIGSALSRTRSGEGLAITRGTQREANRGLVAKRQQFRVVLRVNRYLVIAEVNRDLIPNVVVGQLAKPLVDRCNSGLVGGNLGLLSRQFYLLRMDLRTGCRSRR